MPASVFRPGPDRAPISQVDRRALARFLDQSLDHGFRLAIVEAANHAEREAILADVAPRIGPGLLRVAIDELPGADANVWMALRDAFATHTPRCLALWGIEDRSRSDWPLQLNVQRDLFVRDLAVPWLLFIHPATRVPLLQAAPDFCDFAILWLRDDSTTLDPALSTINQNRGNQLPHSSPVVDSPMLKQAQKALDAAQFDKARDLLSRFDLQPYPDVIGRVHRQLLGARLEHEQGHLGLAEAILRDAQNILARQPDTSKIQTLTRQIDAETGIVLTLAGRYDEAEVILRRSLALVEDALGREHPSYGAALHNLASVLSNRGSYSQAESLLRQCLAIDEKVLGREQPSYGASLHSLASVLSQQGNYPEAERLLRESLAVDEKVLGRENLSYGTSLHELALVLSKQGKYSEAERLLRDCLPLQQKILGRKHPSYGASLHALAEVLFQQGNYPEAERLLRHAVKIDEKALGREHPSYSASLGGLATVLAVQGHYQEAERLLHESLAIDAKALGRDHPSYGATLHSLASVLAQQGNFAEAERLVSESLAINEKALGLDHPFLCSTLTSLAVITVDQGRPLEGISLLERALRIGHATLGADHPDMRIIQSLLHQVRGPQ